MTRGVWASIPHLQRPQCLAPSDLRALQILNGLPGVQKEDVIAINFPGSLIDLRGAIRYRECTYPMPHQHRLLLFGLHPERVNDIETPDVMSLVSHRVQR